MRMSVRLLLLWGLVTGIAHGAEYNFDKKVPADEHGVVEIANVSGLVDVSAWDEPNVEVKANMGGGVDRIEVTSDSGRVSIKVIIPNMSFRSGSADLHVRVPRHSEVDVSAVSADLSCSDVEGRLQLKTVSGNVKADLFSKGSDIKSVSGDILLRGRGNGTGAGIHVSTVSGNIRIDRGSGDLDADTISGDLVVKMEPAHDVRVRTTSGSFGFEGKLSKSGSVDAETVSGDLSVRAAMEGGVDYEVNTFSGDIKDCMGVDAERVSKYRPGRRLIGTKGQTGSDGVRVRLKSMSGDVELCDKS